MKKNMLHSIIQVARLYYEQNLSQQAIADDLGVSRSLIAKYLLQAKAQGIVDIRIVDPDKGSDELAEALKDRFQLDHVQVIANTHASHALTLRAVSHAAATYFSRNIQDGHKVGIAWGRNIKSLVDQLSGRRIDQSDIDVIPLLGESHNERLHSRMNELVEQLAGVIRARPHFLFYPMTVDSKTLYNRIAKEEVLVHINEFWENLDWALVGIGALPPTEGMFVYIAEKHLLGLRRNRAVGDVCCRYFDKDGRFVKTPFGDQMIGVRIDQLKKAKRVVAVSTGREKTRAVRGALKTKLVSTLFVDQALAEAILNGADGEVADEDKQ